MSNLYIGTRKPKSIYVGTQKVKSVYLNDERVWSRSRLPADYKEVEWISASGNNGAYIDLGITFDTKAKSELKALQIYNGKQQIFGAAESSGKYRYLLTISENTSTNNFYGSNGSAFITVHSPIHVTASAEDVYTMEAEQGNLKLTSSKGSETNTNQASYTMTNHLYLFGQNYNGVYRGSGEKTVYYFKHWDKNNELIRDMVPCYRISDDVIGMYDLVTEHFFTNAGTGDFAKGADVIL